MNTTPSELRSEAETILAEIPLAFVQLHRAIRQKPRTSSGTKVAGGTRDFVPINTAADAQKRALLDSVRQVHHEVSRAFGEPVSDVGVQAGCDDLTRWLSTWVWHPTASEWVSLLRRELHRSERISGTGHFEPKRGAICPRCLRGGCIEVNEVTGEHRCVNQGKTWNQGGYLHSVTNAARTIRDRAA